MALINDFMSLIYPKSCEACGDLLFEHEKLVCNRCVITLPKWQNHATAFGQLKSLLNGRIPCEELNAFYVFEKEGRVQRLLHAIKYEAQKELAQHLGELMMQETHHETAFKNIDVIMPIPLHASKLKKRGYNQSEWFAKGLSKQTSKPIVANYLLRSIKTDTQTKKRKYQRWENVEGVFELKNESELIGRHILLVDDVITTGATLEGAWMVLKQIANVKISIASIAFAARV